MCVGKGNKVGTNNSPHDNRVEEATTLTFDVVVVSSRVSEPDIRVAKVRLRLVSKDVPNLRLANKA